MTVSKFKVGDRVYASFHDYGTVTKITNDEIYPINVRWDVSRYKIGEDISTFTPDGYLFLGDKTENTQITKVEEGFNLMDRVFYPYYGKGTIVENYRTDVPFPIKVSWDTPVFEREPYSYFSRDGVMLCHRWVGAEEAKLMLVKDVSPEETGGSEMEQIASVINHNIEAKKDKKVGADDEIFHVGDKVVSRYYGHGVVEKVDKYPNVVYPITVRWNDDATDPNSVDAYTRTGTFSAGILPFDTHERDIKPIDFIKPPKPKDIDEGEEVIERMEEALSKKVDDAVNPDHYRVEGLPEAIDIINHLMHREQYEGFLWGNILKYAYRFGRKGDKAETAGKIAWYATQLKELEECESK